MATNTNKKVTDVYASIDWQNGDVITRQKIKNIDDAAHETTAELKAAQSRTSTGDNAPVSGSLGERLNDMIIASTSSGDTTDETMLWIDTDTQDYTIPVQSDFDHLVMMQDQQPSTTVYPDAANKIWVKSTTEQVEIPTSDELEQLQNTVADEYSTSKTYNTGDYVYYNGQLYKCINNIPTTGAWNANYWSEAVLADDVDNLNNNLIKLSDTTKFDDASIHAVLARTGVEIKWNTYTYIDSETGKIGNSTSAASTTQFIRIPDNAKAVVNTTSNYLRYAIYDSDKSMLNVYNNAFGINFIISSTDAAYFVIQLLSVDETVLTRVNITFIYDDEIVHQSDLTETHGYSNETAIISGNPIVINDNSESSLLNLQYTGDISGEMLCLSGKNLFHFQHPLKLGFISNGVTFHFFTNTQTMEIISSGATSVAISANNDLPLECKYLDGVLAYHNYHFRFKVDTPVTITPGYSAEPYYDSKVLLFVLWVDNGTLRSLPIGWEGATIVAKAGIQYGIRVRVSEGFIGTLTLKPQVEIGTINTTYEAYRGMELPLQQNTGTKNIFNFTHANRLVYISNNVTTEYGYATKSFKVVANAPSSAYALIHPDYDALVNNKSFGYLFKFMPGATAVCVQGIPKALLGLIAYQISDGSTTKLVNTSDPYIFMAEADKEYGFRAYIYPGAVFDYIFKPIIATGIEAIKLFGSKRPVTTVYTDGAAALTMQYTKETSTDLANDSKEITKKILALTAGKIAHPLMKFSDIGPVITIIDDDTTNPTLVQRFHDILAAENVVGNFAVEMRNIENYSDVMPDLLRGYEEEGFGMLYHCYKQAGDADRYWESGNPMYDESLIRENFYRGLRAYRQMGFHSDRYWVTPYGVNDKFIRSLAKEADMECLLTCPTSTYASNSIINIGSNATRWNLPRFIFLSDSDNDYQAKQLIDGCAAGNGWLIIVTHVNSWPSTLMEQNTQRLTSLIQRAKNAGIEIWNFNQAYQTFKPILMLNELF